MTSTLVFEGGGRVRQYVGGYEDWLRQRRAVEPEQGAEPPSQSFGEPRPHEVQDLPTSRAVAPRKKLSYREQQELQQLPGRIDELEVEQQQLNAVVAGPHFYKESGETIGQTLARLDALRAVLLEAYARWDELDSRTKS